MAKEVYIDGVKYVPYRDVIVDKDKLINEILSLYWGEGANWSVECSLDLRIVVGDWFDESEGVSIQEFIEQLARG